MVIQLEVEEVQQVVAMRFITQKENDAFMEEYRHRLKERAAQENRIITDDEDNDNVR